MARPDVINKAPIAPVRGQGLGSTIWYACAWWAIRYFLVGKELTIKQIQMLEVWQQPSQGKLKDKEAPLLIKLI